MLRILEDVQYEHERNRPTPTNLLHRLTFEAKGRSFTLMFSARLLHDRRRITKVASAAGQETENLSGSRAVVDTAENYFKQCATILGQVRPLHVLLAKP